MQAPTNLNEYIKLSEYTQQLRANYFTLDNQQIASSRFAPAQEFDIPVGTWRIDDRFKGIHGHDIEQLRLIDPIILEASEETTGAKLGDIERYTQWIEEGKQMPPINVVEAENGTLRVTDGHRRLYASRKAGIKILAWVSPCVIAYYHNETPIKTGLTYELANK